jgi:uncharacterized protein YndB with AHSA1/START domain
MSDTPSPPRSVVVERELPHSPERVWRALTESALMDQWLMKNDFQPVPGRRFQLRMAPVGDWNGVIEAEVLAVQPVTQLSYTWASGGLATVVTWTLKPTSRGTLVRMEQSGFGPGQDANYKGASYGWQKFLGALETVVAAL